MKTMLALKKAASSFGLVLAVAVGFYGNAKPVWAGYLSTPGLSTSASPGSFAVGVNGTSFPPPLYGSNTSSFGNTIPTGAQITGATGISPITTISDSTSISVTGTTITSVGPNILYDPTTGRSNGTSLNLTAVAPALINPYYFNGVLEGTVESQVFAVTSGSNAGDLVFTYQFNVAANAAQGVLSLTLGSFNSGNTNYVLGEGIAATGITTTNDPTSGLGVDQSGTLSLLGTSLTGTNPSTAKTTLADTVTYGASGLAETFGITSGAGALGAGEVSPELFVATTATTFNYGSISLAYGGISGDAGVYVPATPEPSTLILLGTGLGLLSFLAFRKRQSQSVL